MRAEDVLDLSHASASGRKSEPIFGNLDAQIQRVAATFARLERRAAL
ncbi:hypothetical protein SJ05684_c16710 [Sinorhizobium sojae CCBAU 05684]|uniref:Uncharacterized protein n=1 Tax=Sinorhizobium sojae CCBAU 05684 TaxID=716928 RepID=A0A249PB20_9HYPH|nr:hypothetical protein SJ05684_c16710 [Sinorhizobium sojae CCBAU 05684]